MKKFRSWWNRDGISILTGALIFCAVDFARQERWSMVIYACLFIAPWVLDIGRKIIECVRLSKELS